MIRKYYCPVCGSPIRVRAFLPVVQDNDGVLKLEFDLDSDEAQEAIFGSAITDVECTNDCCGEALYDGCPLFLTDPTTGESVAVTERNLYEYWLDQVFPILAAERAIRMKDELDDDLDEEDRDDDTSDAELTDNDKYDLFESWREEHIDYAPWRGILGDCIVDDDE